MNVSFYIDRSWLIFGIPVVLLTGLALFIHSDLYPGSDIMSLAVTADLIITVPLIYFLLIRKTTVPNTTVVPIMLVGLLVGTFLLPEENQAYLRLFKSWGLPVIELAVLVYLGIKIRKAVLRYKQLKMPALDFFTAMKKTTDEMFPHPVASIFATEIAVIYYGFIRWKSKALKNFEFSYHKTSNSRVLFAFILFILSTETLLFHLLLAQWSVVAAWIVTGISIYAFLQILAFSKSLSHRPITLERELLHLRYGIMQEVTLNLKDIVSIELSPKALAEVPHLTKLSLLGHLEGQNVLIRLKRHYELNGPYGIKKNFQNIALQVDLPEAFKALVESVILKSSNY